MGFRQHTAESGTGGQSQGRISLCVEQGPDDRAIAMMKPFIVGDLVCKGAPSLGLRRQSMIKAAGAKAPAVFLTRRLRRKKRRESACFLSCLVILSVLDSDIRQEAERWRLQKETAWN